MAWMSLPSALAALTCSYCESGRCWWEDGLVGRHLVGFWLFLWLTMYTVWKLPGIVDQLPSMVHLQTLAAGFMPQFYYFLPQVLSSCINPEAPDRLELCVLVRWYHLYHLSTWHHWNFFFKQRAWELHPHRVVLFGNLLICNIIVGKLVNLLGAYCGMILQGANERRAIYDRCVPTLVVPHSSIFGHFVAASSRVQLGVCKFELQCAHCKILFLVIAQRPLGWHEGLDQHPLSQIHIKKRTCAPHTYKQMCLTSVLRKP